MHDHVGLGHQRLDRGPVQDIALPVLGLAPASGRRVERPAGHAQDAATRSSCSSARTTDVPISPVGPVTATVRAMISFPALAALGRQLPETW
jgi:hypothetical protein